MKTQTLWLLVMTGLAIALLGAAILSTSPDTVGKVLAILAIVIGALVAVGPKVFKNGDI